MGEGLGGGVTAALREAGDRTLGEESSEPSEDLSLDLNLTFIGFGLRLLSLLDLRDLDFSEELVELSVSVVNGYLEEGPLPS